MTHERRRGIDLTRGDRPASAVRKQNTE